LIDHVEDVG